MTRYQKIALEHPQRESAVVAYVDLGRGPPAVLCHTRHNVSVIVGIEEGYDDGAPIKGWAWHASRLPGTLEETAAELDGVGEGPVITLPGWGVRAMHVFKKLTPAEMVLVEKALQRGHQ